MNKENEKRLQGLEDRAEGGFQYEATRLASILTGLRSALETGEFERRLDSLEARFAAGERLAAGLRVIR